jgi:hypothetical protein
MITAHREGLDLSAVQAEWYRAVMCEPVQPVMMVGRGLRSGHADTPQSIGTSHHGRQKCSVMVMPAIG